MPGAGTKYDQLARDAISRIDGDRQMQDQLSLLPGDEPANGDAERAARGKGKALNQMRDYLAAKGMQMPEEVIAEIAGLAATADPLGHAMAQTERVLAWATAGAAKEKRGEKEVTAKPTLAQRLNTLMQVRTAQLRAAEALLPYGMPKATPDPGEGLVIPVMSVPAAPVLGDPGAQIRDVTPVSDNRMVPANLRKDIEGNQGVTNSDVGSSDE